MAAIRSRLALPAGAGGSLPCVVEYPGYGGGRGLALDCLLYAAAGYAHFFMDVRGQGSGWRAGDTPDREPHPNPHHPGFMTRGGLDPRTYYYRRVITDAVRAVDAARQHPLVDPSRVAATGHSQGGGLTLAVAGLVSDLAAALPEVPFLCDIRRGTEVASEGPALFSAALMDTLCPASTVYGAYHHYTGPKRIEVYPYNGHEEVSRSIKRCRCGSWPRSSVRRDLGLASRPCTPVRRDLGPEGLVDL